MAACRSRSSSGRFGANSASRLPSSSASCRWSSSIGWIVSQAGLDLRLGRRAVEDPQEQLVDQLGVVRLAADQLGELVARVGDGVGRASGR